MLSFLVLCLAILGPQGHAYSFMTHEQMIDLAWKGSIRPVLLSRFPGATEAQLQEAHAYAYGGCAIQDLGYYPFGHELFSDLTHYVRTGDFIDALFRDARTIDEYAFAIGAMSHYVGDTLGHSEAINPAVAVEFPKLEARYGPSVNYAEGPHAHVRTEFAFDINELSKHRLAPAAYLRHVGLKVPRRLLERAFFETYGLDLREVLGPERPAIRSYRFAVRSFLPRFAYVEVVLHKSGFPPDVQSDALTQLQTRLAQADFQNGWGAYRKKPGVKTYLLVALVAILPKVGALSDLAIRGPQPATQQQYLESLNTTSDSFSGLLKPLAAKDVTLPVLPNRDLDTGQKVRPGGYPLTDSTYAKLLHEITSKQVHAVPVGLAEDIAEYYADPEAPISTKRDRKKWARVERELVRLKGMPVTPQP